MRRKRFSCRLQIRNRLFQISTRPVEIDVDSVRRLPCWTVMSWIWWRRSLRWWVSARMVSISAVRSWSIDSWASSITTWTCCCTSKSAASSDSEPESFVLPCTVGLSFFIRSKNCRKHFLKHLKLFVLLGQSICQMSTNIQLQWIILLLLPVGKW